MLVIIDERMALGLERKQPGGCLIHAGIAFHASDKTLNYSDIMLEKTD
ncbi:MAG: hypothetical protein IJ620_03930 [Bacteroidales bacterium]|nr:hypothetical protein [Bacteroidales bacterium]